MKRKGSSSGVRSRGFYYGADGLYLSVSQKEYKISSGGASVVTVDDVVYNRESDATFDRVINFGINPELSSISDYTIINNAPSIATRNSLNVTTWVSNGLADFTIVGPNSRQRLRFKIERLVGAHTDQFNSWTVGSLAKHIYDMIRPAMVGKSYAVDSALYTTANDATSTYVRNPLAWTTGAIDLTCAAVYNSRNGGAWGGVTAISPRHVLLADHIIYNTPMTVRFVDNSNNLFERTVTNYYSYDYYNTGIDTCVGLLNTALPASIKPAKIIPNSHDKFKAIRQIGAFPFPAVCLNQHRRAYVGIPTRINTPYVTTLYASNYFSGFDYDLVNGDSGHPVFLKVGTDTIIVSIRSNGQQGSGPSYMYPERQAELSAAMTSLGGGYTMSSVDVSSYPNYV